MMEETTAAAAAPSFDHDPTIQEQEQELVELEKQQRYPDDETSNADERPTTVQHEESSWNNGVPPTEQQPQHDKEQDDMDNHDFLHQQDDGDDEDSFHFNDADIQRDAATMRVAMVVHACLVFFAGALALAVVLAILAISQFGFLTFMFLIILATLFLGLVVLVNKTLRDEAQLKPVRRRIKRWKALATAVVINEVQAFRLDWNEHLLLTNGDSGDYELYEDDDDDDNDDLFADPRYVSTKIPEKKKKTRRGGRSVVFKLVVKPFLGKRRKRKKQKEQSNDATNPNKTPPDYVPPAADVEVV